MWELNSGFNLGLLYALTLWWAIRRVDHAHAPDGEPLKCDTVGSELSGDVCRQLPARWNREWGRAGEWGMSLFGAVGVYIFLTFTFLDNAPSIGVWLGLFFAVAIALATWQADRSGDPLNVADRRREMSLAYSVFLLMFITLEGASYNVGTLLELYDPKTAGQYAWPLGRIDLFSPVAAVILVVTILKMWRIVWPSVQPSYGRTEPGCSSLQVADLLSGLAVLGAATIWPAKIGVLYALMLMVSLFAFNRLSRHYDQIDASIPKAKKSDSL